MVAGSNPVERAKFKFKGEKQVKRILSVLLAAMMLLLCTSCQFLKTEETLHIYNAAEDAYVDCVAIAPTPDVLNSEDAIILFGADRKMNPRTANDYTFKVQDSMLNGTWYIYVSGSVKLFADQYGFTEMFKTEQEIGAVFTGSVYGFQIEYDSENQTFLITELSGI